ncbi:MAG: flippase-like domain-containing protein [FCB group bacterium]|nr:flippase-like domain-containing protein [FCB group bacterium]
MSNNKMSMLKSPWISVSMGILISLAGLIWAFYDFSFDQFLTALKGVNYYFILAACGLMIFSVFVRAVRWNYLISVEKKVKRRRLFEAEFIGYFGNFVLPLRLGELLRTYVVSKGEHLSATFVFGSVVLERLLDTVSMGVLTILMVFQFNLPKEIEGYIHTGLIVILSLGVILSYLFIRINGLHSQSKFSLVVKKFTASFTLLTNTVRYKAFALSLVLWLIYWGATHLIQMSMHLGMSPINSLTVLLLTSFVGSIPSAPGMIGTYHAAAKYTLVKVIGGYSASQAINFAVLLHGYGYILFILIGGYYFLQSQFRSEAFKRVVRLEGIDEN